ncbi:hypothetical protein HDU81_003216 [Chytriomyces hyalinus]|nr:hypothetical protein HDU81_003216 [Chytriomyces hyalinus]
MLLAIQPKERRRSRDGTKRLRILEMINFMHQDTIPRLSCFISLLVYHVWTSKTLSQTLDVRNRNQFMITFVKNILEITRIPLPVVTLAVKYIQRLRRLRGTTVTSPGDETRTFSVALILAQKYSDDTPYGNRMWGKVLGLSSNELTRLEISFLGSVGYNLYVDETEYGAFCKGVQALAREWNASLMTDEERQMNLRAYDMRGGVKNGLPALRVSTDGDASKVNGGPAAPSMCTPTSPCSGMGRGNEGVAHVMLGVSPTSTISEADGDEGCDWATPSEARSRTASHKQHSRCSSSKPSSAVPTPIGSLPNGAFAPHAFLSPNPRHCVDRSQEKDKIHPTAGSAPSPLMCHQDNTRSKNVPGMILSPMPGFTNLVIATPAPFHTGAPPGVYMSNGKPITAGGSYVLIAPQIVFVNNSHAMPAMGQYVAHPHLSVHSRAHSRASSETSSIGGDARQNKRFKLN